MANFDFDPVQSGLPGGVNEILEKLNANFVKVETNALVSPVPPSALPIGGSAIGGVKNGGNVVIQSDGTMTAPTPDDGGLIVTKVPFTVGDIRWAGPVNNRYTLTIPNAGAECFGVRMEVSAGRYVVPVADVFTTASATEVVAMNKFAGYVMHGEVE